MRISTLVLAGAFLGGCGALEGGSAALCDEAAAHVAACFPDRQPGGDGLCDAAAAEAILETSCDDLEAAEGKTDGVWCTPWTWWLCGSSGVTEERLASGLNHPRDITVAEGLVFFVLDNDEGSVVRMDREGGDLRVLADRLPRPTALALDATHVYWVNSGGREAGTGSVMRAPIEGGEPELLATELPRLLDIVVDDEQIFLCGDGGLWRMEKTGGPVEHLSDLDNPAFKTAPSLLLAEGALFVIDSWNAPRLLRVDPESGDHEVLAEDVGVSRMRARDGFLYWSAAEGISRIALDGGPVERLGAADEPGYTEGLVLVGDEVIYSDAMEDRVSALSLETGEVRDLATGQDAPGAIAFDGGSLFFVNDGTSFVLDYNEDGEVVRLDLD